MRLEAFRSAVPVSSPRPLTPVSLDREPHQYALVADLRRESLLKR